MKHYQQGSITVFLSLILLLVLAVIMTTVESVRVRIAKVYSERALITAMDSVLAQYYLPLFQEYHIFALDAGYGTNSMNEDVIKSKLGGYMESTFNPYKDLLMKDGLITTNSFNLFPLNTQKVHIDNMHTLTDFDGELFINQAVSYMKYEKVGDGLKILLQSIEKMEEVKSAKDIIESKYKTEVDLYDIDLGILHLIRLIDGITISESGLKLDGDNKIVIKENFVKKICVNPLTKDGLNMENELVYSSLVNHYVSPLTIADSINNKIDSLKENNELKEIARITYKFLMLIDQDEMEEEQVVIHLNEVDEVLSKIEHYLEVEQRLIKLIEEEFKKINSLITRTLRSIQTAVPLVKDIISKQSLVSKGFSEYEQLIKTNKEGLSDGFYTELIKDADILKKHNINNQDRLVGVHDINLQGMMITLIKNERLLLELQNYIKPSIGASDIELIKMKEAMQQIKMRFMEYSHKDLYFDYGTLVKPAESETLFNSLGDMLKNNIIELVIKDSKDISTKSLYNVDIPSKSHDTTSGINRESIINHFESLSLADAKEFLGKVFNIFQTDFNWTDDSLTEGNLVGKVILFNEYLMKHFNYYMNTDNVPGGNVIDYELEYILFGNSKDYYNLSEMINRILLIRTTTNLVDLMSNSKSNEEAHGLATAFVGYTGLPALISITKMLILIVWAFEESLIDTMALLNKKSIPLIKGKGSIQLELIELPFISKTLIEKKVAVISEKMEDLDANYSDYLKMLLFMKNHRKTSFLAMDLIQENIRAKYEDTFYIKNCMFGFRVDAEFIMESKFINLPYIKGLLGNQGGSYIFRSTKEYSY